MALASNEVGRPELVVAAGVLRDAEGRILLAERPVGKHLAGTWEFPGGKCEPGESAHESLARELREELGIKVLDSTPLLSLTHAYPEKTVRLLLREIDAWEGEPRGCEGQALRWARLDEMADLPMPAADRPIIRVMDLEPRYAITPDPSLIGGTNAFVEAWRQRLDAGYRLLQLRAHSLDRPALTELARRCGELARDYGARWLLNGPVEVALASAADGVHLSVEALMREASRQVPEALLLAASCRNIEQLERAGQLGADFVCLAPVRRSSMQIEGEPLGWPGFASLCRHSPVPVMAQGGVSGADLETARGQGAYGVAGSAGFVDS
jgi:8-oxo-dGTP diphosphatase